MKNYLYFGDCLEVLKNYISPNSIDLIYIDPPFNSKRNYNIFFDDKNIKTQKIAFEDTWSLKNINDSLDDLKYLNTEKILDLLKTYQKVAPFAFPYLVMMSLRILELHKVLKPTGSFYLHCDPTMSHYLKTICDVIFDIKNFRNEIIWHYETGGIPKQDFSRKHDIIFRYSKTDNYTFNFSDVMEPRSDEVLRRLATGVESATRAKNEFRHPSDVFKIPAINAMAAERLGYPTQKPLTLLERIIKASSNKNDIILDAFCGCGTSIDAAERLERKWIGIDISPIAISLIKKRLKDTYETDFEKIIKPYDVRGVPTDLNSAIKLWEQNPYAFQDWWIMEFGAFSSTFGSKGPDKGIDGIAKYQTSRKEPVKVAFQVKGGKNIQSSDMDALIGAMAKHNCELGVFLSIKPLTKPMLETTIVLGSIKIGKVIYPKIQHLTLDDFFKNKKIKLPNNNITFSKAKFNNKPFTDKSLF